MFKWLRALFETPPPARSSASGLGSEPRRVPVVQPKPPSAATYRPSGARANTAGIKFTSPRSGAASQVARPATDLEGINDAFTGKRLDPAQAIYECAGCHVYYQESSIVVLREANSSRCMVCGEAQIARFRQDQPRRDARNHTPDAVTLQSYRQHFGRVVTFIGRVHEVKRSRRGSDFAVMFENASWTRGLKMVAFRGAVARIGGEAKLLGFAGKTLTIRGLLIQDRVFGPEIIVDDPSMILRVQQ